MTNGDDLGQDSHVPAYYRLKQLLLAEIESGRYGPGDRLPTEHELCEIHGLSRTPVGRALSELAAEGVVVRQRRRGTFVSEHWEPTPGRRPHLTMLLPEASAVPAPSEAVTEAAIDVTQVPPGEVNSQVQRLAAEGIAPDLVMVDLGGLAALVDAGLLRPLDLAERVPSHPLLGPAVGGSVYAVPAAITLTGLWVQRDLGPAPGTWDELLTMARAARDTSSAVISPLVLHGEGPAAVDALLTVVASNEPAGAPLRFAGEGAREALRLLHGLVEEGLMSTDVVGGREGRSAVASMRSGEAIAMIGSSTDVTRLGSAVDSLRFVAFPAGPGGAPVSLVSGWGVVVTRQCRHSQLAERIAAEIAHQGDDQAGAALGLVSAAADPGADAAVGRTLLAVLASAGRARPWEAGLPVIATQLERVLAAVISGRLRAGAAADATQEVLDAVRAAALP